MLTIQARVIHFGCLYGNSISCSSWARYMIIGAFLGYLKLDNNAPCKHPTLDNDAPCEHPICDNDAPCEHPIHDNDAPCENPKHDNDASCEHPKRDTMLLVSILNMIRCSS
ncbi:hypothetical protein Tco_0294627 [Tanacetum coccineum]